MLFSPEPSGKPAGPNGHTRRTASFHPRSGTRPLGGEWHGAGGARTEVPRKERGRACFLPRAPRGPRREAPAVPQRGTFRNFWPSCSAGGGSWGRSTSFGSASTSCRVRSPSLGFRRSQTNRHRTGCRSAISPVRAPTEQPARQCRNSGALLANSAWAARRFFFPPLGCR